MSFTHPLLDGHFPGLPHKLTDGDHTGHPHAAHQHHENAAHVGQPELVGRRAGLGRLVLREEVSEASKVVRILEEGVMGNEKQEE